MKTCLAVLLTMLLFSSCSTDKTMIANGVNLSKYEYASITQAQSSFGAMNDIEIEQGIYEAVESTRLQMIGERRIIDLSPEQKDKLVLVKYSATSNMDVSTLSISFEDYMTGKTLASCRSSHAGGWTRQKDVKKAIKKLRNRIANIWD